jgi:putative aminopeptidase FrvX
VSFFEDGPAQYILETLNGLGVEARRDTYGNIVARYSKSPPPSEPPIAFVAHMDHPGFEIVEASGDRVVARALGGVPSAALAKPTPLSIIAPDGTRVPAETLPPALTGAGQGERLVAVRLKAKTRLRPPAPAVFELPDFLLDGDTIRMRALDDLAGCAGILAALERLVSEGAEADVYAVFTRAEEVGLYGARLMAEAGTLPRQTLVVSVESSALVPGVAQGEGPVIRTGDASYTFDADAEQVLIAARESIKMRDPGFKCQRHLMSGGTCEATAFAVHGYRATGIAFPLGNYHNAISRIADPEGGVGAEYINVSDYLGGAQLIAEAAMSVARRRASPTRQRLGPVPEDVRRRLEATRSG